MVAHELEAQVHVSLPRIARRTVATLALLMFRRPGSIALATCVCVMAATTTPARELLAQDRNIQGSIVEERFVSASSGKAVPYNVYLPRGYAEGARRYPVIYHLHGLGGSHASHNDLVAAQVERAVSAGVLPEVIVVFPDGQTNSMWADSEGKAVETLVIRELIPHIDGRFRTMASRGSRVIQGFSMGGWGAALYGLKFPELFSISVNYDGSLHTWTTLRDSRRAIAEEIFSLDEQRFDRYSPVPVSYVQTSCAHDLACLSTEAGLDSYRLIGTHLAGR